MQPLDVTDYKVNNISWTTDGTTTMKTKPEKLPCMPPESFFWPEHNINKHSIVLEDAHIQQEAKDGLSSLLEGDNNSIISKSPTDVKNQTSFKWISQPWDHHFLPYSIKVSEVVDEEIKLLENADCISKSLSPWATPVIIVPKNARSHKPS